METETLSKKQCNNILDYILGKLDLKYSRYLHYKEEYTEDDGKLYIKLKILRKKLIKNNSYVNMTKNYRDVYWNMIKDDLYKKVEENLSVLNVCSNIIKGLLNEFSEYEKEQLNNLYKINYNANKMIVAKQVKKAREKYNVFCNTILDKLLDSQKDGKPIYNYYDDDNFIYVTVIEAERQLDLLNKTKNNLCINTTEQNETDLLNEISNGKHLANNIFMPLFDYSNLDKKLKKLEEKFDNELYELKSKEAKSQKRQSLPGHESEQQSNPKDEDTTKHKREDFDKKTNDTLFQVIINSGGNLY